MEFNKKLTGIIGVIALLLGFGGSVVLDKDQIDDAYVCSTNERLGIFDRLSSTSKTGYYLNELGEEKRNVCYKGVWVPLKEYAKSKGIDPEIFLKEALTINTNSGAPAPAKGSYSCSFQGCAPIL